MCDNKNELHQSEYDKSEDYTSTRLDLDITETTDSYPEFDFLDLLRNLQVKEKKVKVKSNSEVSSNKSNLFSDEDSDVEALAKIYEDKYGNCNDYAELGEGYDEEDSFIDNSDVVNDLVPNGLQTEFGGFYINRGKLNFVKEDNSSSSTSEDVDKFLAHNRLNTRKIISDDESEEKESCKTQNNIQQNCNNNTTNIHSSNNNINSNNNNNNNSNINSIINNNNNNNNNNNSNNNNSSSQNTSNNANGNNCNNLNNSSSSNNLHSSVIKSRKRSREYQHKSKKMRKTATPKIPDHLLHKKPFPGSLEYRKNINEFKKNRLKTVETDKKCTVSNSVVNSSNEDGDNNVSLSNNRNTVNSSSSGNNNNNVNNVNNNNISNNNNGNNISNSYINNTKNSDDDLDPEKKECPLTKKKPLTVKELLKERDESAEANKSVVLRPTDVSEKHQSSSSSDSSESSSSDSESCSSDDTQVEKEKTPQKPLEELPPKGTTINGSISKEITAKSFAHLSDGLKELIAKVFEISKEEKNKFFNPKLNPLLLSLYDKLRELPMAERNAVLEHVAEILQMKKGNITKRIKKLLVLQEETKMTAPLRKLKDAVASIMPLLESNYFNEYTKAAGTRSIDPSSLPQRKFPWNEELRRYLHEIVQYRKNCYYIIRPRKESLKDYIKNFLETKVKIFWPKEWMTADILLEEAQITTLRQANDKPKNVTKVLGAENSSNAAQKKTSQNVPGTNVSNRKQVISVPTSSTATNQPPNRKPAQSSMKNPEVKSILIPRKTPQKPTVSTPSLTPQNLQQGSRLQVTLNRLNVQEYLDRLSGSQTTINKSQTHQQISPSRSQQSVSPSRLVKTSSPNSVLNSSAFRSTVPPKNTSPSGSNKSISSSSSSSSAPRNCNNQQSVLKTLSGSVPSVKSSQNSVTISPVNESLFKDIPPSPEVLNLTKNSSVFISKVKDSGDGRSCRSSSPSIGIPLPSGITISPTNASPSNFLAKPQKQMEKNSDVKINVSITKQDGAVSLTKEKREALMNVNLKREGPLQNIPDCISVTSKVVSSERPKYEHVRKRALQEYHQQQHSPERLKFEEKKIKAEEPTLADMEIKDDKFDDKNFTKIFDSVIAKTSETVRQSETMSSQVKMDRFSAVDLGSSGGSGVVKNSTMGVSQFKNYPTKLREVRSPKDRPFYPGGLEEKKYNEADDRNKTTKEQRVQMEMDRVMQNLVELSREKNPDYELAYQTSPPGSGVKSAGFPESYQKVMFK